MPGCTGILGSNTSYSVVSVGTATTGLDTLAVILLEEADGDLEIRTDGMHIEVCIIDPDNPTGPDGNTQSCRESAIGCEGMPGEDCTVSDSNSDGLWSVGEELAIIETVDICNETNCKDITIDISPTTPGDTTRLEITMQ